MDAGFRSKVASPCPASWESMRGDERVRFCERCAKNVYHLSSMTRAEAEALIRAKEGRLCVRFYVRKDGTALTSDCPVGWRTRVKRRLAIAAGALTALLGGFGTACTRGRRVEEPRPIRWLDDDDRLILGVLEVPDDLVPIMPPLEPLAPPARDLGEGERRTTNGNAQGAGTGTTGAAIGGTAGVPAAEVGVTRTPDSESPRPAR